MHREGSKQLQKLEENVSGNLWLVQAFFKKLMTTENKSNQYNIIKVSNCGFIRIAGIDDLGVPAMGMFGTCF